MEIKVGEYIRTDNGIIGKYKVNENWIDVIETNNKDIGIDIEKDIVKHSLNIIDLIEEGDYVDGIKVKEIYICGEKYEGLGVEKFGKYLLLNEIKFKSIVTKEQFSSLEYII